MFVVPWACACVLHVVTLCYAAQLLLVSGANRTLGLSDELFVLGDSVILTVLGQVSFMPILVLAGNTLVVTALVVGGVDDGVPAAYLHVLGQDSMHGLRLFTLL